MRRIVSFLDSHLPNLGFFLRAHALGRRKSRILETDPQLALGTWSSRRLNWLANHMPRCETYLEVGIHTGGTIEAVTVQDRFGVDPLPRFNLRKLPEGMKIFTETSDEFFSRLAEDRKFDLIFLDGLHEYKQTYRDLMNSVAHLATAGIIIIDDVVPCDEISAIASQEDSYDIREKLKSVEKRWHGDVFKVMLVIRDHHPELTFRVIEDPQGNSQGVVWRNGLPDRVLVNSPVSGDDYESTSYSDVFENGAIPAWFCPGSEKEVLTDAVSHLQSSNG